MRFCGFRLPFNDEDPTSYFSFLNTIDLQTLIALKQSTQKFCSALRDRPCSSSLAFLIKSFVHLHDSAVKLITNWSCLESWMKEHYMERLAEIGRRLLMILCRVVKEADTPSFFKDNDICHLEHLVMIFSVLPRRTHSQASRAILNFVESISPFQASLSSLVLASIKEERAQWVELLFWMSQGKSDLPVFLAVTRFADSQNDDALINELCKLSAQLSEGDRVTLQVFLQGTKNFSSLTLKMSSLSVKETDNPSASPVDEFKALLDDKSYISKVKESLLETTYDPDFDDEPVDLYDDAPTPKPKTVAEILDEELLKLYIKDAMIFERTAKARQSAERKKMCEKFKLSHEQVEGWAIMFSRNPRKDTILSDFQLMNYKRL